VGNGLSLRAYPVPGWRPGPDGAALICIRPENLSIAAEGFAARVVRASYLGRSLDCELAVGDIVLRADLPARLGIAEGDTLTLRADPSGVVLVPDSDDGDVT
jgi:hypothetical protein